MGIYKDYKQSKSHVNRRMKAFRTYQKSELFVVNIEKAVAASHERYQAGWNHLKRITGLPVREIIRLREAYRVHKAGAKSRGIEFLLSYEDWLFVWVRSGKLRRRGNKSNQYVMARRGDAGPYSVDNVNIITQHENNSAGHSKSILVGGVYFDSIKRAAGYYGLPYARVKARLRKDWSVDRAFELTP